MAECNDFVYNRAYRLRAFPPDGGDVPDSSGGVCPSERRHGDAIGYLNTMRRVKFKTGEYVELKASDFTQETLLDYIAVERRRELCFEDTGGLICGVPHVRKCNESVITMRSRIWTKMIPVMYCKSAKRIKCKSFNRRKIPVSNLKIMNMKNIVKLLVCGVGSIVLCLLGR